MSTAFIFVLLIGLMLTGMPISIALGLTVLTFLFFLTSVPIESVALKLFTGIENFEIMAIPFFILAGNFLTHGGVARRMINFATSMVGHWYGGLGLAGVMACALFAAISGSSPATVIAIGSILMPAMIAQGFPKRFGAGVITTSGALGILIPPSIVMVIYAVATGGSVALGPDGQRVSSASVGQLFMAGVIPGLMLATLLGLTTVYRAWKNDYPRLPRATWGERFKAFRECIWGLSLIVLVLGGIYAGLFTPTEAAAMSAVYAFHHRGLHLSRHEAQRCAARAARLGQHERDDSLHHHQCGAVLVPDDVGADPAANDRVDFSERRVVVDVPDIRQHPAAGRRQCDGSVIHRVDHRADIISDRGQTRHSSGASRHPDGGKYGGRHVPSAGRAQSVCGVWHRQNGHYRIDDRGVALAADDADLSRLHHLRARNLAVPAACVGDVITLSLPSP